MSMVPTQAFSPIYQMGQLDWSKINIKKAKYSPFFTQGTKVKLASANSPISILNNASY